MIEGCVEVQADMVEHTMLGSVLGLQGQGLIHLAVQHSLPCLQLLLTLPGSLGSLLAGQVCEQDALLRTPLHLAAASSSSQGLAMLLNAQAARLSLAMMDSDGNTALHMACKLGVLERLSLCINLNSGAEENLYKLLSVSTHEEANIRNKKGKTPMFYARTSKMIQILCMHEGTDKMVSDAENHSLLEGLLYKDAECSKALLSNGLATNGKEHKDKNLLLIYNLDLFSSPEVSLRGFISCFTCFTRILKAQCYPTS